MHSVHAAWVCQNLIKPVDQLWMQDIHSLTDVLDFQNAAGLKKNDVHFPAECACRNLLGELVKCIFCAEDAPEIVICCLEPLSQIG